MNVAVLSYDLQPNCGTVIVREYVNVFGLASPKQAVPSDPPNESVTFTHSSMAFPVNERLLNVKSAEPPASSPVFRVCVDHVTVAVLASVPDGSELPRSQE